MPTCPSCAGFISGGSRYCPLCGAPADADVTRLPQPPEAGQDELTRLPAARHGSGAASTPPGDQRFGSDTAGVYTAGTLVAGRYRIVGLLGRGGMGDVYRADDLTLGQPVALKFVPRHVEGDQRRILRFMEEVRAARAVAHPGVCRVYDVGEADGRHFLSMEYIDGEDLATSLRRIGRFPIDKGLEIARQLCAGLAAVHEQDILHRDLKPANVMLDGRGKVRLTDFGLAGEFTPARAGEVAGTPTYMAPELLEGGPATIRSDIYALGLVLYEVFTGRRAFEAPTISELKRLQQAGIPLHMSSSASGIDPAIEEAILRCLATDPARRPGSAITVAALLPGGDPLAAALAAGETPSPAMVAAAGANQGLTPRVALASVALIVVLLAAVLALVTGYGFTRVVPLDYPPDVLAQKAQEILQQFGYADVPEDTAYGFSWNRDFIDWTTQNGEGRNRWDSMRRGHEAGVMFWYRTSQRSIMAQAFFGSGIASGRITADDPPFERANQQRVWLTSKGHLVRFEAVPLEVEAPPANPAPAVDWKRAFEAAGLDQAWFTSVEPTWAPLAWGDTRVAWEGKRPGGSGQPIRVEAASWRGRPISFRTIRPWTKAERQESTQRAQNPITQAIGLSIIFVLIVGAVVLARHNVVLNRSDRRGATRLASFVFVCTMIAWALEADHILVAAEALLLVMALSSALFQAGVVWLLYVALEPYVRRRWPHTVITWNRVVAGRVRDPLVGRDLLFGLSFGLLQAVLIWTGTALVRQFVSREPVPVMPGLDPLLGSKYLVTTGFELLYSSIVSALAVFMLLFLLRIALRRDWLAVGAFIAIIVAAGSIGRDAAWLQALLTFAGSVLAVAVLLRLGLVAYIVGSFVAGTLTHGFPLSTDLSRWYTGPSAFVVLGIAAASFYGYRVATADTRPAARSSPS